MSIVKRLREAADAGEVIKVIYHGGSQPGSIREIIPISISNGKVRAMCYTSNAEKTFFISKIELYNSGEGSNETMWNPDLVSTPKFAGLHEFHELRTSELNNLGWHINNEDNSLSLHRRFKNGKPLRGSDVSLDYEEYTYDSVVYGEDDIRQENLRKRQRPWVVRAKHMETKTYGKLDKAAELFMEQAKLLSPNKNN